MANVIPFARPKASDTPAFADGVPPFDAGNPAHVAAWNSLCAMGAASQNPYLSAYRAPVLPEIEEYLRVKGMGASTFGALAIGDPNIVYDMRAGRDPRSKTVAILRQFMTTEAAHA